MGSSATALAAAGTIAPAEEAAAERHPSSERNSILRALPEDEYQRLVPHLEPVTFKYGLMLTRPGDTERHLYFPTTGTISIVKPARGGRLVEVGSVGYEGVSGIGALFSDGRELFEGVIQVEGMGQRIRAEKFRELAQPGTVLDKLIRRYVIAMLAQSMQSVACNSLHDVEARCARWLLSGHDRAASDEYLMTQEFLAAMLGVRRATVTEAAGALKRAGLITYSRGRIRILDRLGLEAASCECYAIITAEFARVVAK